jgi:DNA-binding MarR family transcriptional regulator
MEGHVVTRRSCVEDSKRLIIARMATKLPLPTLLSQVLVALTIEFDNEFEHQMPHTTTWGPAAHSGRGPWLVSMAMWKNFMQFVGEEGVPLRELEGLGRITNLPGLERWGYVVVEPDPADSRPKPPRSDWVVRATLAGLRAQDVWRPLEGVIEERWRHRLGNDEIATLYESLHALVDRFDIDLPLYLPVLGYSDGMFARLHDGRWASDRRESHDASGLDLAALLSKVLLAFTIDFEHESKVSLAISANTLRVLDERGVGVRDLPRLTGVSKEAMSASVGFLERRGYVVVEPDPTVSRTKLARLVPKGLKAQDAGRRLLGVIEQRWQERFGKDDVANLRDSLEQLVGEPTAQQSPLFGGLEPYSDGWRAVVRKPETLPHYPMVLHRGGYPDGS